MSEFSGIKTLIPIGNDIFNASYGDDKGLYVEFYLREIQNQKKSEEAGRPIFESKEYVKIMPIGDKTKVRDRPVNKQEQGNVPSDIRRFPRQWAAFQNKSLQTTEGTPVLEWPQITRADAESLKAMNIHTIEGLAELGDHNLTWLGARKMRDMAVAWIEKAKTNGNSMVWAREKAEMQAQIDALKNQVNGMKMDGVLPEPAKRGRPAKKKDETE